MTRSASPKAQSRRSSIRATSPTRHQPASEGLVHAAKVLHEQMRGAKEEGSDDEAEDARSEAAQTTQPTTSERAGPKTTTKTPTVVVVGREGVPFSSSLATACATSPPTQEERHTTNNHPAGTETAAGATDGTATGSQTQDGDGGTDVDMATDGASERGPDAEGTAGAAGDEIVAQELEAVYEDEGLLEHEHSEEAWGQLEARFSQCNVLIAFSLTDTTVAIPGKGYMGIQDMAGWIIKILGARGIGFGCDGLQFTGGRAPLLLGRPSTLNRRVWIALRRGYIKVLGATVWMQPAYTGRRASNLSLLELEYVNTNFMSARAVHEVMKRWGATEAIVVSHGRGNVRRSKWPAIECITNAVRNPDSGEYAYTFRLFFECEEVANKVYAASLAQDRDEMADIQHVNSLRLKPVLHVEWDPLRARLYRPTDASEREHVSRRVHVFGLSHELTPRQVEQRLEQLGYKGARLVTQPGRRSGTVELRSADDVDRIMAAYGREKYDRLYVGNVRLSFNTPAADGSMRCFGCNEGGHFLRECRRQRDADQGRLTERGGRASDHWKAISANMDSGTTSVAPGWRLPGGHQGAQVEQRSLTSQELFQQAEPMLRQLIASQVREQSQAAMVTFRQDVDRQLTAVSERLGVHEESIQAIQRAQTAETAKTDRMERMLLRLSEHLLPADFRGGEDAGGASSRQ